MIITSNILGLLLVDTIIAGVAGTIGYFIGARGLEGTKRDLNDIKLQLEKLKTLFAKKS